MGLQLVWERRGDPYGIQGVVFKTLKERPREQIVTV